MRFNQALSEYRVAYMLRLGIILQSLISILSSSHQHFWKEVIEKLTLHWIGPLYVFVLPSSTYPYVAKPNNLLNLSCEGWSSQSNVRPNDLVISLKVGAAPVRGRFSREASSFSQWLSILPCHSRSQYVAQQRFDVALVLSLQNPSWV